MDIDVSRMIGAVTREITSVQHSGRMARRLVATRTYATTMDDVWDALTSPERLAKWFMPISGDLHPGGRYQLKGNASGTIERCDPPASLHITWEYGGEVSWVQVGLTQDGDETRLLLEHIAHVPDEMWDQFGPGAVGVGWDLGLMGLGFHLATGAAIDPMETMTWHTTEQGKAFITGTSDLWGEASIADGTDAEQARAAAQRTTNFYTGQG